MSEDTKQMYQIQYRDNTYRIADFTKEEYTKLGEAMSQEQNVVVFEEGIFELRDIRAIVLVKIDKPDTEHPDDKAPDDWAFLDEDSRAWLRENGMDFTGGGNK